MNTYLVGRVRHVGSQILGQGHDGILLGKPFPCHREVELHGIVGSPGRKLVLGRHVGDIVGDDGCGSADQCHQPRACSAKGGSSGHGIGRRSGSDSGDRGVLATPAGWHRAKMPEGAGRRPAERDGDGSAGVSWRALKYWRRAYLEAGRILPSQAQKKGCARRKSGESTMKGLVM